MRTVAWALILGLVLSAGARLPTKQNGGVVKALDGTAIHFDSLGSGEVRVVLAGGPGMTPSYMGPVCQEVAKTARCVLLHQRGTGRTAIPAGKVRDLVTLRASVEDLEALRNALGQQRLVLVGHSWGGMLAMAYAAAHPARVQSLVLLASGGPTLEYMSWYSRNAEARTNDEDRKLAAYWDQEQRRGVNPRLAEAGVMAASMSSTFYDRANVGKLIQTLEAPVFGGPVFQQMMDDLRATKYDLRPALRSFASPVLIVQGREDPIATVDTLRATFPAASVEVKIVERAGHFLWFEQPQATFEAMARFLGRVN